MQKAKKKKIAFCHEREKWMCTITNALWHDKCSLERMAMFKFVKLEKKRKRLDIWAHWKLHKRKACNGQNWWKRASKNIIYKCKYYEREISKHNKQGLAEKETWPLAHWKLPHRSNQIGWRARKAWTNFSTYTRFPTT